MARKKDIILSTFICVLFLTITLLPNISLAFESATATFKGTSNFGDIENIPVVRFEQNITSEVTGIITGGAKASKADISPAFFETLASDAVPKLLSLAASGSFIPEVEIVIENSASIRMLNVQITYIGWSEVEGKPGASSYALNFGKIYWTYGGVTTGWDRQINRAISE